MEVCYENGDYTPVLGSSVVHNMHLKKKTKLGIWLHYYPPAIFNGFQKNRLKNT